MGSWTGDRRKNRQKQAPPKPKTLVVTDPVFFKKRDKRGLPGKGKDYGYSEEMLEAVANQFELVVIFCPVKSKPTHLVNFLESHNITNFKVVPYEQKTLEDTTSVWQETLLELGASFKRARNPREITYLTLDRFMVAEHITWVGPDDHSKIKIKVEKDKTFQELQAERRKRAPW